MRGIWTALLVAVVVSGWAQEQWQHYTHPDPEFSIAYPSGWEPRVAASVPNRDVGGLGFAGKGEVVFEVTVEQGRLWAAVTVYETPAQITTEELHKALAAQRKETKVQRGYVGGYATVSYQDGGNERRSVHTYFPGEGTMYLVSLDAPTSLFEQCRAGYEYMLRSLRARSLRGAWERPGTDVGEEIIGPDGAPMVWVPPGEFRMGSTDAEIQYALKLAAYRWQWIAGTERPAHQVKITGGFWLHKYEVTNEQFARFVNEMTNGQMASHVDDFQLQDSEEHILYSWLQFSGRAQNLYVRNNHYALDLTPTGCYVKKGRERHPIVTPLTCHGADAYARHYAMSLPTEAEWEYAARGTTGYLFPWGNEWDPRKCCNRYNRGPDVGDLAATVEVGSCPGDVSWCGAMDMAGNCQEWCQDWFDEGYYSSSPVEDPPGPRTSSSRLLVALGHLRKDCGPMRVVRGGCFQEMTAESFRTARRCWNFPSGSNDYPGFRCVIGPK